MSRTPASHPPRVGISRCLLGEPVRYDGSHRHRPALVAALSRHFILVPVCPEAGAGLGVPRPPVQLVQTGEGIRARGVDDPALDVSDTLTAFATRCMASLEELSGFVCKARSPSCGVDSTPLHDEQGAVLALASGLFAAQLRRRFPRLPLCDDEALQEPAACADFIARVWAYSRQA